MDYIGTIAAIVGAVTGIIALRDSKRYILRRIDKKQKKIRKIDYELDCKYGLNRGCGGYYSPLHQQRDKLQEEVEELHRLL